MAMTLLTRVVEFRDGTKITVSEANYPITLRLEKLQEEANQATPHPDPARQLFNLAIYPKLAACSTGKVLSEEDAFLMPTTEQDKWYQAVREMNPAWFVQLDKAFLEAEETLKKKEKKRTRSTNA
jgi:hypothetical protein